MTYMGVIPLWLRLFRVKTLLGNYFTPFRVFGTNGKYGQLEILLHFHCKKPLLTRKTITLLILPSNVLHFSHNPHTLLIDITHLKILAHPSLITDLQTPKTHLSDCHPCTDKYRLSFDLDNRPQAMLHQALQPTSSPSCSTSSI